MLREVFSSSRKQSTPESQPYSVPTKVRQIYSATQRPTYEVARPSKLQTPFIRPTSIWTCLAYRQPYQPGVGEAPSLSYGYSNPAADLGSLAAQGAQTFVQGAQQVGRVFGIDPSVYGGGTAAYEFPLGGGGFFGRKWHLPSVINIFICLETNYEAWVIKFSLFKEFDIAVDDIHSIVP